MAFADAGVITEYAGGAIGRHIRVKYTGDHIVNVAGVADRGIGHVRGQAAFNANDPVAVILDDAPGTRRGICSAALNPGDDVFTAALGKVGPAATGGFLLGKARTKTTAANQVVEYTPIRALGAAAP